MTYPTNARLTQQAILEKALSYFGQANMLALFEYLGTMGINRDEILDMPEKFVLALEQVFGKGAKILERQIILEICMISNVQFDSNMTVAEAMHKLKN